MSKATETVTVSDARLAHIDAYVAAARHERDARGRAEARIERAVLVLTGRAA